MKDGDIMTLVYVVTDVSDPPAGGVIGVFSSRELADVICSDKECRIEECVIDETGTVEAVN